jgi:hypothetical protein
MCKLPVSYGDSALNYRSNRSAAASSQIKRVGRNSEAYCALQAILINAGFETADCADPPCGLDYATRCR